MREPDVYNLTIRKGTDFGETFTITDEHGEVINLTGYFAYAQIRTHKARSSKLLATFVVRITDPANGTVEAFLPDYKTNAIVEDSGYWDLAVRDTDRFDQIYYTGKVTFEETITVIPTEDDEITLPALTLTATGAEATV